MQATFGQHLCTCGALETPLHRYWTCPHLPQDDAAIRNSQGLLHKAVAGAAENPSLWLRGLTPATWEEVPAPPDATPLHKWGTFADMPDDVVFDLDVEPARSWRWYSDGSGGPDGKGPNWRRAAWALVAIRWCLEDQVWDFVGGFSAALAGDIQTVPRSEITPREFFLRRTTGSGTLHTDHADLLTAEAKQRWTEPQLAANPDLWQSIGEARASRRGVATLVKVKAHLDEADIGELIELEDFIGNGFADAMADEEALAAQIPRTTREDVQLARGTASRIQSRLLAAAKHSIGTAAPRKRGTRDAAQAATLAAEKREAERKELEELKQNTTHFLDYDALLVTCRNCGQSCPTGGLREWLRDSRCEVVVQAGRLAPVCEASFPMLGTQRMRPTHAPLYHRGIWWCGRCGLYCSVVAGKKSSAKKLIVPCEAPTAAGRDYLSRLARWLPPKVKLEWPLAAL